LFFSYRGEAASRQPLTTLRRIGRCMAGLAVVSAFAGTGFAQLPPPTQPPENPTTEGKRLLGKILFWEEQLSSDNRVACGTCHIPGAGGADPRIADHPGLDGLFGTADDVLGSPGVASADSNNRHVPDLIFGFGDQVTRRAAQAVIGTQYAEELFWDGRASQAFVDPDTDQVAIASWGGLESQALEPILNAVEMGHAGRTWSEVVSKLGQVRPLVLADNLPSDVRSALVTDSTYPELFERAFGDAAITPKRIAFAIAAYERTLVPDQTPWDAYIAGDTGALTATQIQGWNAYQGSNCLFCHTPPFFTDSSFRNIGLRPWQEDPGRMEVTGDMADRGRFKVPTLRNLGLRKTLMHNGQFKTTAEVLDFYLSLNGQTQFSDNQDSLINILFVVPEDVAPLAEFLEVGLTDPRAAAESWPFDRPTLGSERRRLQVRLEGDGAPTSAGVVPRILVTSPLVSFNPDFRLGLAEAPGGALAFLIGGMGPARPSAAPLSIDPATMFMALPFGLSGPPGNDTGYTTFTTGIPPLPGQIGQEVRFQWLIPDGLAQKGLAASQAAVLVLQ